MRPLAVFDIDGVLADVRHRVHHVEGRRRDWDAFFSAAVDDPPLAEGLAMVAEAARDCDLLYVTGRPERCRADTLGWFREHGLPPGELVMRREGDHRPAREAKPGLLRRAAGDRVVAVVVDDDPQAVAAYAEAGYAVLHATWMASLPALTRAQESDGRT